MITILLHRPHLPRGFVEGNAAHRQARLRDLPVVVGGSGLSADRSDRHRLDAGRSDLRFAGAASTTRTPAIFIISARAPAKRAVKTKLFNWARTMDEPRYAIYQD
jgi:hypothetical protein